MAEVVVDEEEVQHGAQAQQTTNIGRISGPQRKIIGTTTSNTTAEA